VSAIPITRSLPVVLRAALAANAPALHLLVGTFGAVDPSNAYANVVLGGVPVRVPLLRGATETPGAPAYVLATDDFLLCLGTVTAA
jgi:hypothetical protein